MPRHAFVALLLAGSVGCADNNGGMDPPRGIDVLPATSEISLVTGAAGTVSVALKRRGGYTGEVALTVDATPTGVTATFEPPTLPNGTTSSVLTLRVASIAAAGSAPITVRAAGTGVADRTATIQVTITRPPPSTGALTWKFCNPIDRTIWLAVQDGATGVWKQIIGAADTYQFDLVQPTGGVAWVREPVPGNYVTTVFYGTAGEIAEFGANDCRGRTATTKVIAGSVTGFTPSTGVSGDQVRVGTTGASAMVFAGTTFQLIGVPEGPRDFIATRVSHTFANGTFNDTLTKLILRRGINATSSLDPFDFNGTEAVAPTVADLTLNGTNGEPTMLSMALITDPTAPPTLAAPLYSANLGTGTAAALYTVPFALQRDGDLHELSLFTGLAPNPGEANVSGRRLTKFFSGPENQALTMGPPLAIPTTTLVSVSSPRYRAQAPMQPGYDNFYVAEWFQFPDFSPIRAVALILTSAYAGGAAWDATIPDLTAAGWDPTWGLRPGVETGTFFSAEGSTFPTGIPSGAIDRGIVTSASRITLPTGSAADNSKHRDLMLSPLRNNAWFRSLLRP